MSDKKVFDFTERRNKNIEAKRRQFERVMFDEMLGVYSVIDDQGGSYPISLVDISQEGCLFEVPYNQKAEAKFPEESELTLKLFFTKASYIPAVVMIKHASLVTHTNGSKFWRCGCEFDTTLPSFAALKGFVEFLQKYAEFSQHDSAKKVYFL